MKKQGHNLTGKLVSGDDAIRKVIDAESRRKEAERLAKALKSDRDQLLDEYKDLRDARPLPSPAKPTRKTSTKEDRIRVCVGDVHGMLMDRPAVDAFLHDLKLLDPDDVVLGGDIIECGGWLAKHQPIGYVALSDYSYQEDCQAANWFLDQVREAAPNAQIIYIEGNHEDRVERWVVDQVMGQKRDGTFLLDAFGPQAMLRLREREIDYFRRSINYVPGAPKGWIKLGKMFFTHTLGRSKNAARQAAEKTAGNVTYFCTHREDTASVRYPSVGLVKAFNPGCLCSLQPVWKNSDPTDWSHGYGIHIVAKSGNFLVTHIPIIEGESLAGSMIEKYRRH